MALTASLDSLTEDQLRTLARELIGTVAASERAIAERDQTLQLKQTTIEKLAHENALLKRLKFGTRAESYSAEQRSLFEETLDADLAALAQEIATLTPPSSTESLRDKATPKRAALPAHLPRREIRHEPDSTQCRCGCQLKRIGEDISEKLDYTPGVFTVERHVRGKWVCASCETLTQAAVPAQIIDKGLPTAGLLAHVLIAKFADHMPLYRQEKIFERAGFAIARSTLAQWVGVCGVQLMPLVAALKVELFSQPVLHADETPVSMLKPGSGKTHRGYLWGYTSTTFAPLPAVIYDFTESRAGVHARDFLGDWRGTLVTDDYSGYKALYAEGVTEAGCMAHARRKFHELFASGKSLIAEDALRHFGALYAVETELAALDTQQRLRARQQRAQPAADALHRWLTVHRPKVSDGSATAKAIDYSLKRWAALTRYLSDGAVPIDNNRVENAIRPIALGRKNWLFAGSLRAGQRAAAVMSLVQSARLNGHDPYAYLKDVLMRLPTQPASRIGELLPHRWQPED